MWSLPPSVRVFVCLVPVDMRWSFDGLASAAKQVVGEDPRSGHVFVFHGRRGDRVKILYWDRDGYALWYKRLEAGVFRFPSDAAAAKEIAAADLGLILEGVDLRSVKRHPGFALARAGCNFLV